MPLDAVLVEQCAPTLAGLKPASLFRYFLEDTDARGFALQFKYWREQLKQSGLHLMLLPNQQNDSYLLYLYRAKQLDRFLTQEENRDFLSALDYIDAHSSRPYLLQLIQRLHQRKEFPHEIGLFLGYPLEDVKGFIQNKGKSCVCCGCWKVYGDPEAAARRFSSYRACTAAYRRKYFAGTPVTQLIVAA